MLVPVDKNGNKIKCENSRCEGDFDWSWTQHTAWLTPRYDNKGSVKHISVFDNGDGRGMEQPALKEQKYSRAVEYKIDEQKGTVEQTWEFGKERGLTSIARLLATWSGKRIKARTSSQALTSIC